MRYVDVQEANDPGRERQCSALKDPKSAHPRVEIGPHCRPGNPGFEVEVDIVYAAQLQCSDRGN